MWSRPSASHAVRHISDGKPMSMAPARQPGMHFVPYGDQHRDVLHREAMCELVWVLFLQEMENSPSAQTDNDVVQGLLKACEKRIRRERNNPRREEEIKFLVNLAASLKREIEKQPAPRHRAVNPPKCECDCPCHRDLSQQKSDGFVDMYVNKSNRGFMQNAKGCFSCGEGKVANVANNVEPQFGENFDDSNCFFESGQQQIEPERDLEEMALELRRLGKEWRNKYLHSFEYEGDQRRRVVPKVAVRTSLTHPNEQSDLQERFGKHFQPTVQEIGLAQDKMIDIGLSATENIYLEAEAPSIELQAAVGNVQAPLEEDQDVLSERAWSF